MHKPPTITVLMCAYNAEKYIADAITSVLQQSFTDFEFIIINDGSTDNTEKIIKSYKDERIKLIAQKNEGIASALNNGLNLSTAKYIARFDSDDICHPHRLQKQYDFITKHQEYTIVGSSAEYVDQNLEYICNFFPPAYTNAEIQKIKKQTCPFIHSSVLYKKKAIVKKGYNVHAHSFEDHLLWVNILETGKGYNLQEPLLKVRLNPSSITIDEKWRTKEFHQIKSSALSTKNITAAEGKKLKNILRQQDKNEIKQGAYYALLSKKYLWNNYNPHKARTNLKAVIKLNKFHWRSYALFLLSFMPERFIKKGYKTFKTKSITA